MSTDLREELDALARTQTFSPDPSAWDRGRRARRRTRAAAGLAAVAVVAVVAGAGALAVQPDREARTASGEVAEGGAIPSVVELTNGEFEDDWAIGRASVALGGNHLVLIGAEDGRHHHFPVAGTVVALSPDGYRVAWAGSEDRLQIADLRTGDVTEWAFNQGAGGQVTGLSWYADSARLRWQGRAHDGSRRAAVIDVPASSEESDFHGRYGARGIPSPSRDIVALPSEGEVAAAPFEQIPGRGSGRMTGIPVDRALPADLYPDGAVVTPVGWVDEDHVVAIVDPPQSDVVERPRLAVFTPPDQPESEGTWRELLPDLPPEATSFAVDLIPDLTGDPSQELTHDFSDQADSPPAPFGIELSLFIGLGVAAAIALVLAIRWLWRRLS